MMARSFFINLKFGPFIGIVLGLIVSIVAIQASEEPVMGHNSTIGRIYILIMTTFFPYVLSGGISGFLVENVLIENIALSTQFFSKYKIGSIVGCVLGGTCFFYLLLSFGSIGGVLIGGLAEIFLGPKSVLLGMCLGTMVASVVLILSGSFIGLFLGAFADSLVRGLMKIVT